MDTSLKYNAAVRAFAALCEASFASKEAMQMAAATVPLAKGIANGGGVWKYSSVVGEYLCWANSERAGGTSSPVASPKRVGSALYWRASSPVRRRAGTTVLTTLSLAKGVTTFRGFESRLSKENGGVGTIGGMSGLTPFAHTNGDLSRDVAQTHAPGIDVYFRALPIACIENSHERQRAAMREALVASPCGEPSRGFWVFVETLHAAIFSLPPPQIDVLEFFGTGSFHESVGEILFARGAREFAPTHPIETITAAAITSSITSALDPLSPVNIEAARAVLEMGGWYEGVESLVSRVCFAKR